MGIGEAGTAGTPNDQGFDEWFGFLNQDHALDYYPTHLWRNRSEFFPKGNQGGRQTEYVQNLFADAAVQFIRANRSSPFFLYLAFTVPHASSELGRHTGDGFVVPDYGAYAEQPWPRPEKGFAAMVSMLDRDVGRVCEELQIRSAGPFRGRKGELYEGGIRALHHARSWTHQTWLGHRNSRRFLGFSADRGRIGANPPAESHNLAADKPAVVEELDQIRRSSHTPSPNYAGPGTAPAEERAD
ncbi:MAG: sulfatase-like hydrolase/transferase [Bryobacteraceae bacterium]|nr:sulfatase-like hydrolase/transferase [Bryobacteraceae bacterium]